MQRGHTRVGGRGGGGGWPRKTEEGMWGEVPVWGPNCAACSSGWNQSTLSVYTLDREGRVTGTVWTCLRKYTRHTHFFLFFLHTRWPPCARVFRSLDNPFLPLFSVLLFPFCFLLHALAVSQHADTSVPSAWLSVNYMLSISNLLKFKYPRNRAKKRSVVHTRWIHSEQPFCFCLHRPVGLI